MKTTCILLFIAFCQLSYAHDQDDYTTCDSCQRVLEEPCDTCPHARKHRVAHKLHKHHAKHKRHVVHKLKETPIVTEEPPLAPVTRLPANVQCGNKALSCFEKFMKGRLYAIDPLPPCMQVFVNAAGYMRIDAAPDFEEKTLPNINFFKGTPGCYIACHSTNPDKAVFPIDKDVYVIGQIRIQGRYIGPECLPLGYETAIIKNEAVFTELCSKSFQCVGHSCWAGSNTGELFGIE